MGKGWPYAAAAAGVELPGQAVPAVLLLAKPIDDAAVRKLAEKARGAVLLSDGNTRRASRPAPSRERELLRAAVGLETRGPIYQSADERADGTWAAAVSPLVPGLWLWTFASGAAAAHDAESTAAAHHGRDLVGGRRARAAARCSSGCGAGRRRRAAAPGEVAARAGRRGPATLARRLPSRARAWAPSGTAPGRCARADAARARRRRHRGFHRTARARDRRRRRPSASAATACSIAWAKAAWRRSTRR